jgi:hypothetical protein
MGRSEITAIVGDKTNSSQLGRLGQTEYAMFYQEQQAL